jgi:predicted transcriptional regulator
MTSADLTGSPLPADLVPFWPVNVSHLTGSSPLRTFDGAQSMDYLMDVLLEVNMEGNMDIHVILPGTLVERMDRVARELDIRRTELLRQAVVEFLDRMVAERIEKEMEKYVDKMAPYSGEFVQQGDKHVVKRLLRETKW